MGCLADMNMQEKVMEVDYNYASPHYGSGSKCPAQPIWSLAALAALRAIDFFACVCVFPATTQAQRRVCMLRALLRFGSSSWQERWGVRWNDQHVGRLLSPSAAPPASPALYAAGCQKELENLAMVHLLPQLCLQNVLSGLFQVSLSGSWQVPGINVPFTLLNSLQNFHDHHRHGQGILPRARHLS